MATSFDGLDVAGGAAAAADGVHEALSQRRDGPEHDCSVSCGTTVLVDDALTMSVTYTAVTCGTGVRTGCRCLQHPRRLWREYVKVPDQTLTMFAEAVPDNRKGCSDTSGPCERQRQTCVHQEHTQS
jgi:hypothetical protein